MSGITGPVSSEEPRNLGALLTPEPRKLSFKAGEKFSPAEDLRIGDKITLTDDKDRVLVARVGCDTELQVTDTSKGTSKNVPAKSLDVIRLDGVNLENTELILPSLYAEDVAIVELAAARATGATSSAKERGLRIALNPWLILPIVPSTIEIQPIIRQTDGYQTLEYEPGCVMMTTAFTEGDEVEIVDYKERRYTFKVAEVREADITIGIPHGQRTVLVISNLASNNPALKRVIEKFYSTTKGYQFTGLAMVASTGNEFRLTNERSGTRKRLEVGLIRKDGGVNISDDLSALPRIRSAVSRVKITRK